MGFLKIVIWFRILIFQFLWNVYYSIFLQAKPAKILKNLKFRHIERIKFSIKTQFWEIPHLLHRFIFSSVQFDQVIENFKGQYLEKQQTVTYFKMQKHSKKTKSSGKVWTKWNSNAIKYQQKLKFGKENFLRAVSEPYSKFSTSYPK